MTTTLTEPESIMTSNADNTDSPVLPDHMFELPSREQWVEMAVSGLGVEKSDTNALHQLRRTTLEGIPLEVLYDTADSAVTLAPGEKSVSSWDNRLCVKGVDAGKASDNILQGLQGGITSVELHTSTPADIPTALAGVQLDLAKISLRSSDQYETCLKALLGIAIQQGLDKEKLPASINVDPIGAALSARTPGSELSGELARMANFTKATAASLPSVQCLLVDVAQHHNAGASTVEELHAAVATATVYLEMLVDAGMPVNEACAHVVFQVAMDADVLLGVAKLRALRALWQFVIDQFDSGTTNTGPVSIVAETSQRFLSTREPWNNHLRNLCAGTAAMLASTDALIVHPHDLLQRRAQTDTSLGDRMARNLAIILERECGLGKVHDPMAGSYAIENLTQQLMQHAWQSLASTDTAEGWIDELLSGRWQERLACTHNQRLTLMQNEQRIAVGVNRFVQSDKASAPARQVGTNKNKPTLIAVRDSETFEQANLKEMSS